MKMKTCSKCKEEKALTQFNSKGAGRISSNCKACQAIYFRSHYTRNKKYYRDRNKRRRADNLVFIQAAKKQPCTDCGIQYAPHIMDFDHLSDKDFSIASVYYNKSIKLLEKEIAKCEVVCANCHRDRTYKRRKGLSI